METSADSSTSPGISQATKFKPLIAETELSEKESLVIEPVSDAPRRRCAVGGTVVVEIILSYNWSRSPAQCEQ